MTNTTSATAAAAAKIAKPKKTKTVSHAKPAQEQTALPLPGPALPEFGMMDPKSIFVRAQVRTEFDENSLRELAADIADRGILQPLTVRKTDEGFVLVAGERRLRAALLASLEAVPVLVSAMSEDEHHAAQLAENIQREELTTFEEAHAIRKLYNLGRTPGEIADMVHKSKSWVSKRLTASEDNLHWIAKSLMENGATEDLEIVITVDKIARLSYTNGHIIADQIKAGTAGRQSVRDYLEETKKEVAAYEKQETERDSQRQADHEKREIEAKERKAAEKEAKRISLDECLYRFQAWANKETLRPGSAFLEELDEDQHRIATNELCRLFELGANMNPLHLQDLILRSFHDRSTWRNGFGEPQPLALGAMLTGRTCIGDYPDCASFLDSYKRTIIDLPTKDNQE